jgi:SAM-dependent methyltransferase
VPGATFVRVPSEDRLPFPDGAFDACYASEVIEHLFDVSGFIREMNRVLVPGGLLLLTTPYHGWLKNVIVVTTNFDDHFAPTGGHIRFFSKRSLSCALVGGGFRVEEISGIGRVRYLWKSMFVVAEKV